MSKKVLTLNLDEDIIAMLKKKAGENDRSLSSEVNRILKKELQKK